MRELLSKAAALWLCLMACLSCSSSSNIGRPGPYYESYQITPATDSDDDGKYASYLYTHLANRTYQPLVTEKAQPELAQLRVEVRYDPSAPHDYAVDCEENTLRLTARTREAMIWLLYQFISEAGEKDLRVDAMDLPPALLQFDGEAHQGDFAFEHRSIYSPANAEQEMLAIRGTNNVDYDWGLWGHHMTRVFPNHQVPESARALVDGHRHPEQVCLSSEELYRAYENYIVDMWGEGNNGDTVRFAVMPEDNGLVCQCKDCLAAGNTPTSASPALAKLLTRLATRFPNHLFFAGGYGATKEPPKHKMPPNTGVLLSALDVPMAPGPASTPQGRKFASDAQLWSQSVGRLYVWDFMRNFDDYFTPYPFLHLIPERLSWYKDLGVKGLFFNGSGATYASFDGVQTYVLSCLMVDPTADVEQCIRKYFARYYPVLGDMLCDYYIWIEHSVRKPMPVYGGMGTAMEAGFNADKLKKFETELRRLAPKSDERPRKQLNMLLTALSYSELEVMRAKGELADTARIKALCDLLWCHDAFPSMSQYRESYGDVDAYLHEWAREFNDPMPANPLKGTHIAAKVPLDPEYPSTDCLTDGQRGFGTDYHTGWMVFSGPELRLMFCGSRAPASKAVHVGLLNAPAWHIELPARVELWQDGAKVSEAAVPKAKPFTRVDAAVPTQGIDLNRSFELRIPRQGRSMALDEVRM